MIPYIKEIGKQIDQNYRSYLNKNNPKHFHYYSRLYWWTNEEEFKEEILYKQHSKREFKEFIKDTLKIYKPNPEDEIYIEYPMLIPLNRILFALTYNITIFDNNFINTLDTDLLKLIEDYYKRLIDDKNLHTFRTARANFLTHCKHLLNKDLNLNNLSQFFLDHEIIDKYLYGLTHLIIGNSNFYANRFTPLEKQELLPILKEIEKHITTRYFEVKLDVKFEFIVCCRLLAYKSPIENIIASEAIRSFDEELGIIKDTYNINRYSNKKVDAILYGEHRNVLFLMGYIYDQCE